MEWHKQGAGAWKVRILILITAVTTATYLPILWHEFVGWDDDLLFTQNPHYHPVTLANVFFFWTHAYKGWYTPLANTFGALVALLSGQDLKPAAFHTANLILHVMSSLLVFAVLLKILQRVHYVKMGHGRLSVYQVHLSAAIGAMFFALHPVQVESVAWASAVKDLLAGMFSLLAVHQYLRYGESGRRRHYVTCLIAFILALFSKPNSLGLPFVILVLDWWLFKRTIRHRLFLILPLFLISVPFVVVNKLLQPDVQIRSIAPVWARPLIAGDALAFYLWKLAVPLFLGPDYGRNPAYVLGHWWGYLTWLVPCGLAIVLVLRSRSSLLWAYSLMVAGLIPVLGFMPFYFQTYSTVADRYLYFPMLGPALAVASLMMRAGRRYAWSLVVVVVFSLGVVNIVQQRAWANTGALFSHALKVNPRSLAGHKNRAALLIQEGRLEEAKEHLNNVLEIDANDAEAHNNLGFVLEQEGNLEGAASHYHVAMRLKPNYPEPYMNMGNLFARHERFSDAVRMYRKASHLDSSNPAVFNNLGFSLSQMGLTDQAIKAYSEAIRLSPRFAEAHANLGNVLMSSNRFGEAAKALKTAVELNPGLTEAHNSLAVALFKLGDYAEAWKEVHIYVEQGGRPHPDFVRALSTRMPDPGIFR